MSPGWRSHSRRTTKFMPSVGSVLTHDRSMRNLRIYRAGQCASRLAKGQRQSPSGMDLRYSPCGVVKPCARLKDAILPAGRSVPAALHGNDDVWFESGTRRSVLNKVNNFNLVSLKLGDGASRVVVIETIPKPATAGFEQSHRNWNATTGNVFRLSPPVGGGEPVGSLPYLGVITVGEERSVVARTIIEIRETQASYGSENFSTAISV